jgi:hypothetical protein
LGALSTPGTGGASLTGCRARPAPAAFRRPVPSPRSNVPPRRATIHEASTKVHAIHPSGLPLTRDPPGGRRILRLSPRASHPAVTSSARQGQGQASSTRPELHNRHHVGPPNCEFTRKVRHRVATADECTPWHTEGPFACAAEGCTPVPVPLGWAGRRCASPPRSVRRARAPPPVAPSPWKALDRYDDASASVRTWRACGHWFGDGREQRKRVFDRFFTTKPVAQGTRQGLNLAFASIVTKHGGDDRGRLEGRLRDELHADSAISRSGHSQVGGSVGCRALAGPLLGRVGPGSMAALRWLGGGVRIEGAQTLGDQ